MWLERLLRSRSLLTLPTIATRCCTSHAQFTSQAVSPAARQSVADVHVGLQQLQLAIDQRVIGHAEVKEALLLGLLAQEHM